MKDPIRRWSSQQRRDERKPEDYPLAQRVIAWLILAVFVFLLVKLALGG
jgi:hypothetical protein